MILVIHEPATLKCNPDFPGCHGGVQGHQLVDGCSDWTPLSCWEIKLYDLYFPLSRVSQVKIFGPIENLTLQERVTTRSENTRTEAEMEKHRGQRDTTGRRTCRSTSPLFPQRPGLNSPDSFDNCPRPPAGSMITAAPGGFLAGRR
jgi:hypothetical protein